MNAPADLASRIAAEFGPALTQHGLCIVAVDALEALLVGSQHALHFVADREGIEAFYIERDKKGLLDEFTLRPLVMERFLAHDRALYGHPASANERLDAAIRVYASGLVNRCQDVLGGETTWLRRDTWRLARPNAAVERAFRSGGLP